MSGGFTDGNHSRNHGASGDANLQWSGRRSREAAREREGSKIYKWSGCVREQMEPVDEDRGIQNFFNMAMSMGLRREAEEDPVEEELL